MSMLKSVKLSVWEVLRALSLLPVWEALRALSLLPVWEAVRALATAQVGGKLSCEQNKALINLLLVVYKYIP